MMRDHAPIPPSGHGKGVTRLLFKFDENHDGALSREELEKYRKEGLEYTKQMSENTVPFEKADLNHDGFLTFDEYLQNITYDVYNSFNSEELKSRLVIGNINLKPALALMINLKK